MEAPDLPIADMVLAAGALGTAAFGIVEGFKFSPRWASAGFSMIKKMLGPHVYASLAIAYGDDFETFLRAQYIEGRSKGDVHRALRQGIRIGLKPDTALGMADDMGLSLVGSAELVAIADALDCGDELDENLASLLSRFELAVDTRVDAALALADNKYRGQMQLGAMVVAIVLAFVGSFLLEFTENPASAFADRNWFSVAWDNFRASDLGFAIIVGVASVPLAPIAKNVASALGAATKLAKGRR